MRRVWDFCFLPLLETFLFPEGSGRRLRPQHMPYRTTGMCDGSRGFLLPEGSGLRLGPQQMPYLTTDMWEQNYGVWPDGRRQLCAAGVLQHWYRLMRMAYDVIGTHKRK